MSTLEIVLLVIGIGAFIASFIIPEKISHLKEDELQFGKDKIKELVENEINSVKNRVEEVADETINDGLEKTQRSLERISNEKIMVINEYSEIVIKEINKSHEEVMFLYDMLNDKQKNIKNTVHEVEQTAKAVKQSANEAKLTMESIKNCGFQGNIPSNDVDLLITTTEDEFKPIAIERVTTKIKKTQSKTKAVEAKGNEEELKKSSASSRKKSDASQLSAVDIQFTPANGQDKNNNEKILELHKCGKTNMSIAKELNLGVGEVKLVIDLFEGM
ncbi:MAG TPA: DUF6115 domain-containing protein [Lachnospiraceae bacterium]|nr:DUF6115 domain-containing protein [Lachnospiraceae bacterium]